MGFITPELPDVDHDTWLTLPAASQTASGDPALGGAWLRYAVCDLSALRVQDGRLRRGRCGGHLADTRAGRARSHRRRGGRSRSCTRSSSSSPCCSRSWAWAAGPARSPRRFWPPIGGFLYWLRPKTIRLPPWPQRGSVHQRRYPHHLRRRPLRHRAGLRRLGAAVTRPWRVGHRQRRCRSDRSRSGGADDRRSGAAGSARQNHLPGRPRRALLAETVGVLLPVHRPDRRLQDHHARAVVGSGDFQAQPPFSLRRRGDDEQQRAAARQAVQLVQAHALPRPGQRLAPLVDTEAHGPRRRDHGGIHCAGGAGLFRRQSSVAVVR